MKRYCWNCEKDTKHITYHEKYGENDKENPTIMYERVFKCVKCNEGYVLKWYFRNPILRKVNGKRRIRYGKQKK